VAKSKPAAALPRLADPQCERAMLSSVWLAGKAGMLLRLDEHDFTDPWLQWLFRHLRAMAEEGEPLSMVALLRRVRRPGGVHGLQPFDVEVVAQDIAGLLGEWQPVAHIEYFFRVLRTERLRRATIRLAETAVKRISVDQHDPVATLEWLIEQAHRLKSKAPKPKGAANVCSDRNANKGGAAGASDASPGVPAASGGGPDAGGDGGERTGGDAGDRGNARAGSVAGT
jgi:hypothetical protein